MMIINDEDSMLLHNESKQKQEDRPLTNT